MADDYRRVNVGHAFPLARFADQVYQMRTDDAEAIPEQAFKEEVLCMERHKMVVRRELVDRSSQATTEWHFRHDKVMEFFIVRTFLGNGNEKPVQHLGDTRFRGVYFLLAMLMPLSEAQVLAGTAHRLRRRHQGPYRERHVRAALARAQTGLIDDVYLSRTGYRCWNRERV
jgi:hypothetical protein